MIYNPQKEVSLLHQVKFCTIAFWKKDKIVRTSDQFFWLFFFTVNKMVARKRRTSSSFEVSRNDPQQLQRDPSFSESVQSNSLHLRPAQRRNSGRRVVPIGSAFQETDYFCHRRATIKYRPRLFGSTLWCRWRAFVSLVTHKPS